MYCQNCGKEIDTGVKFCPYYGEDVTENEVVQSANERVTELEVIVEKTSESDINDSADNMAVQDMPLVEESLQEIVNVEPAVKEDELGKVKKNRRKFIYGSVAVVALAVIVALVFSFPYIFNSAKKAFSSPDKYYHYVEQKAADDASEHIESLFDRYNNYENIGSEGSLGLKVDKDFFTEFEEIELPDGIDPEIFENMEMFFKGGSVDKLSGTDISFSLSGKSIISAFIYLDNENNKMYFKLPELSDKYLGITSSSNIYDEMLVIPGTASNTNIDTNALIEAMPSGEQVAKLYNRYVAICSQCIEDVEEEIDEIEVNGIKQKCTLITSTINEKTFKKMYTSVLEAIKNDKEIETILKDIAKVVNPDESADDMYHDFIDNINEQLDDIDNNINLEEKIEYKVWVNGKGEIIGRGFKVEDEVDYYYIVPVSGGKFGFEAKLKIEDECLSVVGNGKLSVGKLNGEFDVKFNKAKLFKITVKDFDRKSAEDGYLNCKLSISLSEEIIGLMSISDSKIDIEDYKFDLDIKSSEKSGSIILTFVGKDKQLATLSLNTKIISDYVPVIPEEKDTFDISNGNEDALLEYCKTIDVERFIAGLRTTVLPKDLVDTIEQILNFYAGVYNDPLSDI